MALQGTIDTFELTEVVRLLAAGSKTGVLRLEGSRGSGRVWVDEGKVTTITVDHAPRAESLAEAMFELLRFEDGHFTFASDELANPAGEPTELDGILVDAEAQLAEWREIEVVVPTTRALVTLRRGAHPGRCRPGQAALAPGGGHRRRDHGGHAGRRHGPRRAPRQPRRQGPDRVGRRRPRHHRRRRVPSPTSRPASTSPSPSRPSWPSLRSGPSRPTSLRCSSERTPCCRSRTRRPTPPGPSSTSSRPASA